MPFAASTLDIQNFLPTLGICHLNHAIQISSYVHLGLDIVVDLVPLHFGVIGRHLRDAGVEQVDFDVAILAGDGFFEIGVAAYSD